MHITSSPIPPRLIILKALNTILTSLHISRFVLASHSYGTFLSAYLLRPPTSTSTNREYHKNQANQSYGTFTIDPPINNTDIQGNPNPSPDPEEAQLHHALASKIAHAFLIDPIPILLHLHFVAYNFLYRHPRTAAEWQLWYFASSDADVARTLHRAFFWEEGCLWGDDLVRFMRGEEVDGDGNGDGNLRSRHLAVALAGKDQIVPAEIVRRYLTGESQPCARWVGRARSLTTSADTSSLPASHQFKFDRIDEEEGRSVENGKLEVLFYPELDHATVFDTRERRGPMLDVLARFVSDKI
jgi:hypothetical protein